MLLHLPHKQHVYASHGEESMIAGLVPVAIVILLILIWILVKMVNVVFRAFAAHPKNKGLWVGVGLIGAALVAVGVTNGDTSALVCLGISIGVLVVTAKFVDLYNMQLLQEQTTTVDKVLRRPWWQGNTNNTLPQQKAA